MATAKQSKVLRDMRRELKDAQAWQRCEPKRVRLAARIISAVEAGRKAMDEDSTRHLRDALDTLEGIADDIALRGGVSLKQN